MGLFEFLTLLFYTGGSIYFPVSFFLCAKFLIVVIIIDRSTWKIMNHLKQFKMVMINKIC